MDRASRPHLCVSGNCAVYSSCRALRALGSRAGETPAVRGNCNLARVVSEVAPSVPSSIPSAEDGRRSPRFRGGRGLRSPLVRALSGCFRSGKQGIGERLQWSGRCRIGSLRSSRVPDCRAQCCSTQRPVRASTASRLTPTGAIEHGMVAQAVPDGLVPCCPIPCPPSPALSARSPSWPSPRPSCIAACSRSHVWRRRCRSSGSGPARWPGMGSEGAHHVG